jgi:L-threonylcarbamoyladenylate synthase
MTLEAAEVISRGGVIAFRTDTFYGLGADPLNPRAVRSLFELKGREEGKPILVVISDLALVDRFIAHRSPLFDRIADRFWPGPLTIVGPAREDLSSELTAGTGTVGVRLPDDERVRPLVRLCGGALTATSANLSGKPPARTAAEVKQQFPNGIDLILDDGEVTATLPSTVIDLSGDELHLIREGAISKADFSLFGIKIE